MKSNQVGETILEVVESAPGRFLIDLRRYVGAYLRLLGVLLVGLYMIVSLPFSLLFDRDAPLPHRHPKQ